MAELVSRTSAPMVTEVSILLTIGDEPLIINIRPSMIAQRSFGLNLEDQFDPAFVARLALREKQIQQSYRPIIGVHKWFARRPGTVFRSLLLAEFDRSEPLARSYWQPHQLSGIIADPFMGGGTPLL